MSRAGLLAALVVLVGLGLRVAHATSRESLWRDEAVDWFIVTESATLGELLHHFEVEGAPPLHYVLEFLLVRAAGPGLTALRVLAIFWGTLTVFLVLLLGWRTFGWPTGVLSGLVAATSPFLVYFSTEIRNYALFGATAVFHVLVYLRFLQRPSWKGSLSWGAAAALMAYVHYYAFHIILCAGLYFLWRHRSRRALGLATAAGGAFLLLYLPWIPTLLTQIRNDLHPWFVPKTDVTAALDVLALPFGAACAYALPLSLVLSAWIFHKRADDRAIAFWALFWIGVGGALCGWIAQHFAGPYVTRHLLGMAVMLIPAACVCWAFWARLPFRRSWLAWTVIVLLVVLHWRSRWEWTRQPSSARAIAELVRAHAGEDDLVWCSAIFASFQYYFDGPQRQIAVPYMGRKTRLNWKELPERLEDETVAAELVAAVEAQLNSGGSVWVVGPYRAAAWASKRELPPQRLGRAHARIQKRAMRTLHEKGVQTRVWRWSGYREDLALLLFRPR